VLHLHNLDHVEVDLFIALFNRKNGVDNSLSQFFSEIGVEFCSQACSGDLKISLRFEVQVLSYLKEKISVNVLLFCDIFKGFFGFLRCHMETIVDQSRMDTVSNVGVSFLQQFTNKADELRSSVSLSK
jgi:hypothetical protein